MKWLKYESYVTKNIANLKYTHWNFDFGTWNFFNKFWCIHAQICAFKAWCRMFGFFLSYKINSFVQVA